MKMILTNDEIELLNRINALSPEVKARIDRLINSWIKRDEEKKSTNNIIVFPGKNKEQRK